MTVGSTVRPLREFQAPAQLTADTKVMDLYIPAPARINKTAFRGFGTSFLACRRPLPVPVGLRPNRLDLLAHE